MVLAHNVNTSLRTQDVRISEDIKFNTMLLSENTLEGLKKTGFFKPSPIQLHGIPLGKCGFDLLLEAKSGTGKTAVFSVIALEKLNLKKGIQTIILAPTREIAFQIHDVIRQIGIYYKGLKVEVLIGGMPVQEDIEKLQKHIHIIVGSPGRIKHLIQDKYLNVSAVRLLVLDEADKLMEKSFLTDIDYIFSKLPKQKQVIMSSATYPEQSKEFINKYVKNVQHICPDSNCILLGIEQKVTTVSSNSNIVTQTKIRFEELKKIISQIQFKQCLIFCNYQARVGELYKMLTRNKWPAEQLYGQQEQTERLDALKTLQEYKCRILISTDLAARGIDASNVDLVINFEPPYEWQTYLHRIGRAGRYGSYGTAITILSEGKETQKFKEVLAQTGLPLNLKNMWTETPFSLENGEVNLEPTKREEIIKEDTQLNHSFDELWNALSQESNDQNKDKNDLLTFESLCNSFKSCQVVNDVESFIDLMTSFKNHDVKTNCNDGYRIVNVNKLPKFSTVIKQKIKQKPSIKTVNSGVSEQQVNETVTTESMSLSEEPHSDHKDSVDSSDQYRSVKLGVTDSEQALIDAGLPIAFGKAPTYREQRYNNSRYQINDNMFHKKKYSHSTSKNRKDFDDYDNMPSNKRNDSSSSDSNSVESQSNMNTFYTAQAQKTDKSNHRQSNISYTLQQERINEFNIWYQKLKAQSKQIEQIVYLEEMRKFQS